MTLDPEEARECDRVLFGMASIGAVFYVLMCGISAFAINSPIDLGIILVGMLGSLAPIIAWICIRIYSLISHNQSIYFPRIVVVCGLSLLASMLCVPTIVFILS